MKKLQIYQFRYYPYGMLRIGYYDYCNNFNRLKMNDSNCSVPDKKRFEVL